VAARTAIIDTSVVVSGLLTRTPGVPTVLLLERMLAGTFRFLLSPELFAEYRSVLLRPKIQAGHGLAADELDFLLDQLASNATWHTPSAGPRSAPDADDDHLWALLDAAPGVALVTGERLLIEAPEYHGSVISPREFLAELEQRPPRS
jgi:predicted nucleic acid-binding protein